VKVNRPQRVAPLRPISLVEMKLDARSQHQASACDQTVCCLIALPTVSAIEKADDSLAPLFLQIEVVGGRRKNRDAGDILAPGSVFLTSTAWGRVAKRRESEKIAHRPSANSISRS
jgi:hypothetical protein